MRAHLLVRHPSLKALTVSLATTALICLAAAPQSALAQRGPHPDYTQSRDWQPGFVDHMRRMRQFPDHDHTAQDTPAIIPKFEIDRDDSGILGNYQPGGATFTRISPFFQDLGSNGRTCFTCHQPQEGWAVSANGVRDRFNRSGGTDPIFRVVDGATCPNANVSTLTARRQAYSLLTGKGLIRIGLPLPAAPTLQFKVNSVSDPYHCNTNATTGLTSPTTGIISVYRRPLPSTNLNFLSTVMWDGREPDLLSQAVDATLGHAQADVAPTPDQAAKIVAFETGVFTAQAFDFQAGDLHVGNANGGPVPLSLQLAQFYIGVNDPFGSNPHGTPFTSNIFNLYKPWLGTWGFDRASQARKSIARGEELFNTTPIKITGVGGINDALNQPSVAGFCGTCHDTPNVGDHSVKAPLNIGIADAGALHPPALDISGLPVFTLQCTQGPLAGKIYTVTDPGRALISGQCADIGKLKGPILRGLAARAPFFHNGSAATLVDVVNFYDQRFAIGFTSQEKQDLVNFLNAL